MPAKPNEKGWYELDRSINPIAVSELQAVGHIPKLSITHIDLVTVRFASRLICLQSVEQLWLWCNITRRAMRRVIQLPGLTTLDILFIRGPGSLAHFNKANSLKTFRAHHCMSEHDLTCVSTCHSLEEIGAQGSDLTRTALSALLELPYLRALDIEATKFDDAMARRVARSKTISSLDIGGTRITGKGLRSLVEMPQLKSLDLWATKITEEDLAILQNLPNLEYLSLGNYDGFPSLDSDRVIPLLLELPSLKRIWLDGVSVNVTHRLALESKLESVRITNLEDTA